MNFPTYFYAGDAALGEHTSVAVKEGALGSSAKERYFSCFGSAKSEGAVYASTSLGTTDSRAFKRAKILEQDTHLADTTSTIPMYAGIRYAVGGVCHQAANRVMFVLTIPGLIQNSPGQITIPEIDCEKCPSYLWSKLFYGRYGRSSTSFKSINRYISRLVPYVYDTKIVAAAQDDDEVAAKCDSSNMELLRDALPPSIANGFASLRHTSSPRRYSKKQRVRVAEVIRGVRAQIKALAPKFTAMESTTQCDRLLQVLMQLYAPHFALLIRDEDFGKKIMAMYVTPVPVSMPLSESELVVFAKIRKVCA